MSMAVSVKGTVELEKSEEARSRAEEIVDEFAIDQRSTLDEKDDRLVLDISVSGKGGKQVYDLTQELDEYVVEPAHLKTGGVDGGRLDDIHLAPQNGDETFEAIETIKGNLGDYPDEQLDGLREAIHDHLYN